MRIEHKAPVQNDAKERSNNFNPNLAVADKEGKMPKVLCLLCNMQQFFYS